MRDGLKRRRVHRDSVQSKTAGHCPWMSCELPQLIPLIQRGPRVTARGAPRETELAILFDLFDLLGGDLRGISLCSPVTPVTASAKYLRTALLIPPETSQRTERSTCKVNSTRLQKGISRPGKLRAARARH